MAIGKRKKYYILTIIAIGIIILLALFVAQQTGWINLGFGSSEDADKVVDEKDTGAGGITPSTTTPTVMGGGGTTNTTESNGGDDTDTTTEEVTCADAPVDDAADWLSCLNYNCSTGQECYWQPRLGRCDCQGIFDCGYHYDSDMEEETCEGDCDVGDERCQEFYDSGVGNSVCECREDVIRVFVTSNEYTGEAIGGRVGANKICNDAADDGGLGGDWYALLSDGGSARDFVFPSDMLIYRLDNIKVADDRADMFDGSLDKAITIDENLDTVSSGYVWTGSKASGLGTGIDCDTWSNLVDVDGTYGEIGPTNYNWMNDGTMECKFTNYLYCVEQKLLPVM